MLKWFVERTRVFPSLFGGVTRLPEPISVSHSVIIAMKCLRPSTGARPGVVERAGLEMAAPDERHPGTGTTADTHRLTTYRLPPPPHYANEKREWRFFFFLLLSVPLVASLSRYGAKCFRREKIQKIPEIVDRMEHCPEVPFFSLSPLTLSPAATAGDTNMMAHNS